MSSPTLYFFYSFGCFQSLEIPHEFFFSEPAVLWNLSSLTRDPTRAHDSENTESTTGPLGNSHLHEFYDFFFLMSQKNCWDFAGDYVECVLSFV